MGEREREQQSVRKESEETESTEEDRRGNNKADSVRGESVWDKQERPG